MGVNDLEISTNHPFNKYEEGQQVRGNVHFVLDEPQKVRGVYVKFKGVAEVLWKEVRVRKTKRNKKRTYIGEHEYFNEKIYLVGEPNGNSFDLPPGEYNYNFEYTLPVGLPSSFQEEHGSVSYTVKVVLDVPWAFDSEQTIQLNVESRIDLNTIPELKKPFTVVVTKNLYCCCYGLGPLNVNLTTPKTGYVHGDTVQTMIDVENGSDDPVENIKCKLKKVIRYHSQSPPSTKECETNVCVNEISGVPAKSSKTYDCSLYIPEGVVYNLEACELIDYEYLVEVEAVLGGCHSNLVGKIPLKVGHVPFTSNEQNKAPPVDIMAGLGTPYPYPSLTQ